MFNRKRCPNCGEKTSKDHNFCPFCRSPLEEDNSEWGMLGKNDIMPSIPKTPRGFNSLFNNLIKNLNHQFQELDNMQDKGPKVRKTGISISINALDGRPPEIKIKKFGDSNNRKKEKQKTQNLKKTFSEKQREKFSKLPKQEPETILRRFSDKVAYEMKIPGLKSLEDVSINQLQNSIEIKAITNNTAYSKIISIGLPLKKYDLFQDTLVLELEAKE